MKLDRMDKAKWDRSRENGVEKHKLEMIKKRMEYNWNSLELKRTESVLSLEPDRIKQDIIEQNIN